MGYKMEKLERLPGRRFSRFFGLFRRVVGFNPDETGGRLAFKSESFGERNFCCITKNCSFRILFNNSFLFCKRTYNLERTFSFSKPNWLNKPFYYPRIISNFLEFSNLEMRRRFFPRKNLRFIGRNKGILFEPPRFGKSNRGQKGKEQNNRNNLFHSIYTIPQEFCFVKEINV